MSYLIHFEQMKDHILIEKNKIWNLISYHMQPKFQIDLALKFSWVKFDLRYGNTEEEFKENVFYNIMMETLFLNKTQKPEVARAA